MTHLPRVSMLEHLLIQVDQRSREEVKAFLDKQHIYEVDDLKRITQEDLRKVFNTDAGWKLGTKSAVWMIWESVHRSSCQGDQRSKDLQEQQEQPRSPKPPVSAGNAQCNSYRPLDDDRQHHAACHLPERNADCTRHCPVVNDRQGYALVNGDASTLDGIQPLFALDHSHQQGAHEEDELEIQRLLREQCLRCKVELAGLESKLAMFAPLEDAHKNGLPEEADEKYAKSKETFGMRLVKNWTEDDVHYWFDKLSRKGEWYFAREELERARKVARDLKLTGKVLQQLDAEGWEALGIVHPILRAKLVSQLSSESTSMKNKVVHLKAKITVQWVCAIDVVNQIFQCQILVQLSTQDEVTDDWDPKMHFLNLVRTEHWTCSNIRSKGETKFIYRITGDFFEQFELFEFPLDSQRLTLHMSSSIKCEEGTGVEFEFDRNSRVFDNNVACGNAYWVSDELHAEDVSDKQKVKDDRPHLHIYLSVERKPFAFIAYLLPLILLNLMCLCVWAVPHTDAGSRLEIALTLVLTAVAFKTQTADWIPRVSYLTLLDKYILVSFLYMTLVVVENFVLGYLSLQFDAEVEVERAEDLSRFDTHFFHAFLIAFFVMHIPWALALCYLGHKNHDKFEANDYGDRHSINLKFPVTTGKVHPGGPSDLK